LPADTQKEQITTLAAKRQEAREAYRGLLSSEEEHKRGMLAALKSTKSTPRRPPASGRPSWPQ
jgi:hypothetical protein